MCLTEADGREEARDDTETHAPRYQQSLIVAPSPLKRDYRRQETRQIRRSGERTSRTLSSIEKHQIRWIAAILQSSRPTFTNLRARTNALILRGLGIELSRSAIWHCACVSEFVAGKEENMRNLKYLSAIGVLGLGPKSLPQT